MVGKGRGEVLRANFGQADATLGKCFREVFSEGVFGICARGVFRKYLRKVREDGACGQCVGSVS